MEKKKTKTKTQLFCRLKKHKLSLGAQGKFLSLWRGIALLEQAFLVSVFQVLVVLFCLFSKDKAIEFTKGETISFFLPFFS